jgi:probable F420-dependent oxidoreductase
VSSAPSFGVMLPSFASSGRLDASGLRRCRHIIEELGFDSIWAIDHFVSAPMYGQTWLDPLLTLTFVAATTVRVKVGTAVLVLPLRNPVHVARDVAAMQLLSDNRFILGVGAGWNPLEFAVSQVSRAERGRRTDESIEVLRLLLSGRPVRHDGEFFQFPEVSIQPAPDRPPSIWVGGGSQPQARGSTAESVVAPQSVIRRIAAADGWIAPSTSPPHLIAADWIRIQAAVSELGRDPASVVFAHMNSFHLVDTDDRDRAHSEQQQAFERYLGPARPWDFARQCYLLGSLDDVIAAIRRRLAMGVTYFILGPVISDVDEVSNQLKLLRSRVLPAVAEPPSAGYGRHDASTC